MTSRILARCLLGATLLLSVAPASAMAISDFAGHISGSGPDAGVSVAVYIYNSAKKYLATAGRASPELLLSFARARGLFRVLRKQTGHGSNRLLCAAVLLRGAVAE